MLGDLPVHARRPGPGRLPDLGRCRCVQAGRRAGAGADGRFLHARSSTIPCVYGQHRRRQRAERRLCDGRPAADRAGDRRLSQGRRSGGPRADFRGRAATRCARRASRCSAATRCRIRRSSSATRSPARSTRRGSGRTPARSPGDVLLLTKAIGTGVIATALKFDRAPAARRRRRRSRSMLTLNRAAARGAARAAGAARSTPAPTSPASAWSATRRRWRWRAAARWRSTSAAVPLLPGALRAGRRQHAGRRPDQRASTSAPASGSPSGLDPRTSCSCSTIRRRRAACWWRSRRGHGADRAAACRAAGVHGLDDRAWCTRRASGSSAHERAIGLTRRRCRGLQR